MKIIAQTEENNIATVFVVETKDGKQMECVESIQPPLLRSKKWTLIISTLYGCPVRCSFCDAGDHFKGRVSKDDMFGQIKLMTDQHFPNGYINVEKLKIQFARMGEPTLNPYVLDLLEELPSRLNVPGLLPSLSTVAPESNVTDLFFEKLLEIKNHLYDNTFQLQFSLHSTDFQQRSELIPIKKWSFERIARYGQRFVTPLGRKITLNFALSRSMIVEPQILLRTFDPKLFLVKITPLNPTFRAQSNNLCTKHDADYYKSKADEFRSLSYETIISIGELEENYIGSNCGQYVSAAEKAKHSLDTGYSYKLFSLGSSN